MLAAVSLAKDDPDPRDPAMWQPLTKRLGHVATIKLSVTIAQS